MALLVLAALLGLLGYGPKSRASAGDAAALSPGYDRGGRAGAPTEYRLHAAPALSGYGGVRLRLDASLLEEVELESIRPEPREVRTGPGYTEFAFATDGGERPADIVFQFRPATFGHVRGQVATQGAAPLLLDQYVLP